MRFRIVYLNDNGWACGGEEVELSTRAEAWNYGSDRHPIGRCGRLRVLNAEPQDAVESAHNVANLRDTRAPR